MFFHHRCHSNIHPQAPTGDFACALLITPLHLREIKCPEGGVGVSKCACFSLQWNISEQIVWLGCLQSCYVMRASHWFIYLFFYTTNWGGYLERLGLKAVGGISFSQSGPFTWRTNQLPWEPRVADRRPLLLRMWNSRWTPLAEWIPNICQFITAVLHHVIGPPRLEKKKKSVPFPVHISGAPWNNYFQISSLPSKSATLFWFSD